MKRRFRIIKTFDDKYSVQHQDYGFLHHTSWYTESIQLPNENFDEEKCRDFYANNPYYNGYNMENPYSKFVYSTSAELKYATEKFNELVEAYKLKLKREEYENNPPVIDQWP